MGSYRLSHRAIADLEDIYVFTRARFGEAKAEEYAEGLRQSASLVAENPALGLACDSVRQGYRRLRFERHVIFYKVMEDHILIVRVLHVHMNFTRHL